MDHHLPPPLPAGAGKPKSKRLFVLGIVAATLLVGGGVAYVGGSFIKIVRTVFRTAQRTSRDESEEIAGRQVVVSTNTLTERLAKQRTREFRKRQYLEAYREFGSHKASWNSNAVQMLETWIGSYGRTMKLPSSHDLCDDLVEHGCDDPLILTVAASNSTDWHERVRRLEKALPNFDRFRYRAYPRFFATVYLASGLESKSPRIASLDEKALKHYEQAFIDGSFQPKDEEEIAEILINEWGSSFFRRNADAMCRITRQAKGYHWLALVLQGENEVKAAWKARGSDWGSKVTQEGWKGFYAHLTKARAALTEAWEMQPARPMAPASMIAVEMAESGAEGMRTWFDRATAAQVDYPQAWSQMRWGLRPRWSGSHEAMLALGVQAVKTKRFDTDVPRKFFDIVSDLEAESELKRGEHIYGRADIWPHFKEMYEGYIAEPSEEKLRSGWRTSYAVVAFLAGENGVAREQLEAMDWQPVRKNLSGWGLDLSLLPLKVAALTGKSVDTVKLAESSYDRGDLAGAVKLYEGLEASAEGLERDFSRSRLAALRQELLLAKGEWVELLPADDKDPNWGMFDTKARRLPDGLLDIESGPTGHKLYCRTRVGSEFEITGEFEPVRSSTKDFQAGIIMGASDFDGDVWYAFRIKRNAVEGDLASFSQGWTTRQVAHAVTLSTGRNSFQFRLREGKADAWVNGTQVLERVSPVKTLHIHADSQLGLGAYNDMNETVIRYSNMRVRRLVPGR